ncbi:hypothetical protein L1049_010606 [Liquidambar formosana]|uniref:Uncharacterized protein n=1 Tax=Liquidambar formosana TaxID=63359 RepID=A0AAP0NBE5_LIQFO
MGANLCSFKRLNSEPQRPKAIGSADKDVSAGSSIFEFVKPACLKTEKVAMKKKKRESHPPEKKIVKGKKLTLEEWLVSSPGLKPADCILGGEPNALKNYSKKVYPSSNRDCNSRPRESLERLVQTDEGDEGEEDSEFFSLSTNRNGKVKKRVSFKLPEEADIFIFYSPEETHEE